MVNMIKKLFGKTKGRVVSYSDIHTIVLKKQIERRSKLILKD